MVAAQPAQDHLDGRQQSLCRKNVQFPLGGLEIVFLGNGGLLFPRGTPTELCVRKDVHLALGAKGTADSRAWLRLRCQNVMTEDGSQGRAMFSLEFLTQRS